jgi:hypothetical protein
MSLREFVTYSFAVNVGRPDRVFRVASGVVVAAAGWFLSVNLRVAIGMTVLGVAWFLTGAVSRCGIYYLLGLSTCRARTDEPRIIG